MLTVAKSAEGETKYQYDNKGYLISVTNPGGDVVQYTYDGYGRKQTMTYPDGRVVKYAYDSMDRMVKVTGLDGRDTQYTYDPNGQRIKTEDGTLTTEYGYDNVGNLTSQKTTGRASLSFEYGYDLNGNITAETRTENGAAVNTAYTYDARGELTAATKSDGFSESYAYDAAGNMTQKLTGGVSINMTYNAANQLLSMQSENGTIAYSYDQNGNLTTKALGNKTDTYTYDAMDQLTAYTGYDGYRQRYTYNAQGMRSAKEVNGDSKRYTFEEILSGKAVFAEEEASDPADEWVKTSYIYDVTAPYYEVISEKTKDAVTAYDYGIERISANFKNGLYDYKTAYVYDGRGSVAQEVTYNASWAVLGSWLMPVTPLSKSYSPFGEMLDYKISGYGFNGEQYDAATGMINLRARQYEPAMMRFAQKDSVPGQPDAPLTQNLFGYCGNDPVNMIDPSGHIFNFLAGIIGAAVGAVVGVVANGIKNLTEPVPKGQKRKGFFDGAVGAAVGGGITGLAAGVTCGASLVVSGGALVTTAVGAVGASSTLGNYVQQGINKGFNNVDPVENVIAGVTGGLLGGTGQQVSNLITGSVLKMNPFAKSYTPNEAYKIMNPSSAKPSSGGATKPNGNTAGQKITVTQDENGNYSCIADDSPVISSKDAAEKIVNAERIGTALDHTDAQHRAASYLTQEQLAQGKTFNTIGGDKVKRTLLQVNGELNGSSGIYEYILDPNGKVTHQRFIEGGIINGSPNQKP